MDLIANLAAALVVIAAIMFALNRSTLKKRLLVAGAILGVSIAFALDAAYNLGLGNLENRDPTLLYGIIGQAIYTLFWPTMWGGLDDPTTMTGSFLNSHHVFLWLSNGGLYALIGWGVRAILSRWRSA